MKSIVSFDIDMTLLDHKTWAIPHSALKAVEQLRSTHYIVLATGRDMDHPISADIRRQLNPDAIIHLNGTKITVGNKLIFDHYFNPELLKRLLSYSDAQPFSIGTTIDGKDYYTNQEAIIQHDLGFWGNSNRCFQPASLLMEKPVRTLAYIGERSLGEKLAEAFPEINVLFFAGYKGADLVEKGSSKAKGLRRLCRYFQCDMQNCIAFGDSMNDMDIIKEAGLGIAMGNALDELKDLADYITSRIDEDGIWNACIQLGLFE